MRNMDLEDVIKKRKSVRVFQNIDISDIILSEVLSLANKSPSAGAIRGYTTFITKEKINRINAPVYLVICTKPEKYAQRYGERGKNLYSLQDATIFGAYIQLILINKGLDSCWIGAFREEKIKRLLKISEELRPIAIIALGYAKSI